MDLEDRRVCSTLQRSSMSSRWPAVSLFSTPSGWLALLGTARGLRQVTIGHPTKAAARAAIAATTPDFVERDWHPVLRQRCVDMTRGKNLPLPGIAIDRDRPLTAFQSRVIEIVQSIPPGQTMTYGQVAALAGSPGAARAVGQVMATNPVPLVIPCHRVVGSSGQLGGFSAPGGIATKQTLLTQEATFLH